MSNAIERTNEIICPINERDWTDHSGHNAHWHGFCEGYKQAESDIIQELDSIIKWPPGENEVKKILRIEELIKTHKGFCL